MHPASGDLIIAVNTIWQPAILVRELSRTAVPFHEVTSRFVFGEGHLELTIELSFGRSGIRGFGRRVWIIMGTVFEDGLSKKMLNMIFGIVWPVPKPLTMYSEPIKALLELVERLQGLKIEVSQVKKVFGFGKAVERGIRGGNSLSVARKKAARVSFLSQRTR
jgi:hypothetical protein